jgi:hypothetical protein
MSCSSRPESNQAPIEGAPSPVVLKRLLDPVTPYSITNASITVPGYQVVRSE